MGAKNARKESLADALFTRTQQRVLGLMYGKPGRSYYANEIVRMADIGIGTVQRELERLVRSGLLTCRKIGNQKHYQANPSAPIFVELVGIVRKTFGLRDVLFTALSSLEKRIRAACIYGSVASGDDTAASDIDLLVLSDELGYDEVFAVLGPLEAQLGRAVSPTLYTLDDFRRKLRENNAFARNVLEGKKIFLIGSDDDLAQP